MYKKRLPVTCTAIYIAICLWIASVYNSDGVGGIYSCPFHTITGTPCWGCGITRGLTICMKGDIAEGLKMNPNTIIPLTFITIYPVILAACFIKREDYVTIIYQKADKFIKERKYIIIMLLFLEIINWVYLIKKDT